MPYIRSEGWGQGSTINWQTMEYNKVPIGWRENSPEEIKEIQASESWKKQQMQRKIDASYKEIEENNKKIRDSERKKAEEQYAIAQNAAKAERDRLVNKTGALTPEEIDRVKNYDKAASKKFSDLSREEQFSYSQMNNAPQEVAKTNATIPAQQQGQQSPGSTAGAYVGGGGATGGSGGGDGAAPRYTPPPLRKNEYTFADGHREFDSASIPKVLQNGKITPARYFAQNGMNWYRDAKRMANELGMQNYRGTPGENYQLVQMLEDRKNGVQPGADGSQPGTGGGSGRKFDGIKMGDNIPNRFTEEDRQAMAGMSPDEQNKYISQRALDDLRKMLPGNVALINKVFGTKYTSDDLTGGIGRKTIMGTGMTQAGMEVQRLIDGLKPGVALKYMQKGGELDNSEADNLVIAGGDKTVQTGRRKVLEDIVDGKASASGTSIDEKDTAYMEQYKQYKAEKLVADLYNQKISEWNAIEPKKDPIKKNLLLREIQQLVNTTKATNPTVYQSLKGELDRIPEFARKGKIPLITDKPSPATQYDQASTGGQPSGGSQGGSFLSPTGGQSNVTRNVPGSTTQNPKGVLPGQQAGQPQAGTPNATPELVLNEFGTTDKSTVPTNNGPDIQGRTNYGSSGGYQRNAENEGSIGYSAGMISKG